MKLKTYVTSFYTFVAMKVSIEIKEILWVCDMQEITPKNENTSTNLSRKIKKWFRN